MSKIIRRSLLNNKGRLFLTLLSISLGVGFVSASFLLADSLRTVFNQIGVDIFAGVDAQVRAVEPEFTTSSEVPRFSEDLVEIVAKVPGVSAAQPGIATFELIYSVDDEGKVVRGQGPPVITTSWGGPGKMSPYTLIEGSAPIGQQVAMDPGQAEQGGFRVGDQVTLSTPALGLQDYQLSGLVRFGSQDAAGAYFIVFDLPTTQRALGAEGQLDSIVIAADGVSENEIVSRVAEVLPPGVEVVPGETVVAEAQETFGVIVGFFSTILLGFAIVILFVSIFIIYNTFAILVGQRTRQIGLLRAVGASRTQVRIMVLIEAAITGLIASVLGLLVGIGIALALKWLFSQGGGGFPEGPLEFRLRTVVIVFAVGILQTVFSAMMPAFRASSISPLEALRESTPPIGSRRNRVIAGLLFLIPGVALLSVGLFGQLSGTTGILSALGAGSALTFVGVSMLSALFASGAARLIGRPIEAMSGVTAQLAHYNAGRNPQRTASTATALMIGLALITGVAVIAQSIRVTLAKILDDTVAAELLLFEPSQGLPVPAGVVEALRDTPQVGSVSGVYATPLKIDGEVQDVAAVDNALEQRLIGINVDSEFATLESDQLLVYANSDADETKAMVGDQVQVEFEDGKIETFEIAGTFAQKGAITSDWIIERSTVVPHLSTEVVDFVAVSFAEGVDPNDGRTAVDQAVEDRYPQVSVQDNEEFIAGQEDQINQLLFLVWGMLTLSLLIAFFGIVNTMALSVLERTREIGLLRSVGMTRRQLRRTIRYEALIIAIFGSLLGIGMGVILASAGIAAIPDEFIGQVSIPWTMLATFLVLGGAFGILAAVLPARRAAKLNMLTAIATT